MQKNSSNSFNILGSKHFHLWQWSFDIVLFPEINVCTWPLRIWFSIVILCLWVSERCLGELLKDCHRQTSKPVVWIYRLAITPQPKVAIFSHRKRWIVSTVLNHHTIMWKQRFQHLKALFIHFMQFCGPWIKHKKWQSNAFGSRFKMTKISLLVTLFTIFFLPFHLAIGRQRCPKNLG